jgi:hypothetical protein
MSEPPTVREDGRGPRQDGGSDFERMMAFMGRLWHRLIEAITQAEKQVLNKS